MILERDTFLLKLAQTDAERMAALRLRHRVFVEELGAEPAGVKLVNELEVDEFDRFFDHLILIDRAIKGPDNVVGTYRLQNGDMAAKGIGFYSATEFDLRPILGSGRRVVELGRSCVDARYRGGLALHLLWQGVADYVRRHDIELLFGVASFAGTRVGDVADGLAFLHHNHLAPPALRVSAQGDGKVSMGLKPLQEIDRRQAVRQIPSLIKSYLRLGGYVGEGAFVDHAFNTIDVCLILDRLDQAEKRLALLGQGIAA
jgi:putative hemolysin